VERLVQLYEEMDNKGESAKWRKVREAIQATVRKPAK